MHTHTNTPKSIQGKHLLSLGSVSNGILRFSKNIKNHVPVLHLLFYTSSNFNIKHLKYISVVLKYID